MLPSLVEAAASGISGSNLTVLNGSQGVNEMAVGVVAQGLSIFDTLRKGLANGNGSAHLATESSTEGVTGGKHDR
jgi:flotillin